MSMYIRNTSELLHLMVEKMANVPIIEKLGWLKSQGVVSASPMASETTEPTDIPMVRGPMLSVAKQVYVLATASDVVSVTNPPKIYYPTYESFTDALIAKRNITEGGDRIHIFMAHITLEHEYNN